MTKEEILNGMSEEEFYSLYPTKEAWEQAQQQMAYGGIPDIMGVPFGAGIMLANGGTPYYGGPIYPAQYGTSVFTEKKMTPQQWEKYNIERGYQKVPAGKAQSNKPGAYSEFYNPKEYTMGEEAWGHGPAQSFKKVGAPADYDYNKDPNYKPIVQYGYKDPIVSKPVMPWSPAGTVAGSKEGLFYKNQNPALGKFVFREGKYTQYMDDQVAAATPVTPSPAAPVINKYGGAPCYECGGLHMEEGGGLSRGEDYGSKKKPYPSVKASDFAGGGRSYPIPTRADAVDALRLAGLHGRSDVKAKVYAKYPDLKKQVGGSMTPDLQGQYPTFGYGGYDSVFNYGQFPAMQKGGNNKPRLTNQQIIDAAQGDLSSDYYTGNQYDSERVESMKNFLKSQPGTLDKILSAPGRAWDWINTDMPAYIFSAGARAGEKAGLTANEELFPDYSKERTIVKPFTNERVTIPADTSMRGLTPAQQQMKLIKNHKKGGDTTEQGGNQSFLDQRNSTYMNYIKNNVLKNMHEEESQKVQDAFMQMESQYMQMGGNSFNGINLQNAALQDLYAQQIDQYQNQRAQDQDAFRQANVNFWHLDQAQSGKQLQLTGPTKGQTHGQWAEANQIPGGGWNGAALANQVWDGEKWVSPGQQSSYADVMHQLATEFGPTSRRTGLPLFPGNMSPYYGIGKKDAEKLSKVPQGFKMEGFEMTPKYGLLGRTRIGRYMGIGPKSIHYKFTGKRGYLPGEPQPDESKGQYGPAPAGTIMNATESLKPYDPETNPGQGPYNFNAKLPTGPVGKPVFPTNADIRPQSPYTPYSEQFNEPYKKDQFEGVPQGFIAKQIYLQSQLQPHAYGGNFQGGGSGYPTLNIGYGNPVDLKNSTTNQWSYTGQQATPDYTSQAFGKTTPIKMADESKNTAYEQSPRVQYDATRDKSQEEVSVEGDIKRKWKGVGETIGQWAIPALNKVSSFLEQKDYNKAKKKLEESMLADNTFMTSPMNAKNRGDYDPNSGMFRPDQMVPVQFPGYAQWGGFNTMAFGGGVSEGEELDLTPEEIDELRQQGYEIEYLD